ncbi:hypothetical protein [Epilithonimonas arachidiradicis]|uniref:C1q domain-containing protein n=1 Tax=Epilithonimonas arachidiradicis TaxID=1617282 RepID=A0A420CLG0_9FLAO|nr:hypothetical protein [Epilithonimonas arachidiradicis]RKE79133.1 hypothetical protein BXY58_3398 [Epilithonimonas arachidiradicis]GGG60484.1 hypothetical protein GCM10007332_22710 [Epilithonimonas arachidiradicis]
MKKHFLLFVVFVLTNIAYAQVGINTSTPKSTLDINGNLKIRTLPVVSTYPTSDQVILILDKNATTGDFEVRQISADILFNNQAYYASKTGSWSLLDLGLGNSWYKVNLTGANDTKLGNPLLFNTGVFTAQQSGVYAVTYEFQLTAGVDLDLLGGKRLGILKNGSTVWDEKVFDGIRLNIVGIITIASVPVTSTTLTSLVHLNSGDTLTFAVNTSGVLPINLGVLTNGKVNINIHKVSNQTQ